MEYPEAKKKNQTKNTTKKPTKKTTTTKNTKHRCEIEETYWY